MNKVCLCCKKELKGRADKKFCDDLCRTNYNNRLRKDTQQVRSINNVLRKNRKIIEELLLGSSEGKLKISSRRLSEMGFQFAYHTHTYTTRVGATYLFCYEYGYLPLEKDTYMLVKSKSL